MHVSVLNNFMVLCYGYSSLSSIRSIIDILGEPAGSSFRGAEGSTMFLNITLYPEDDTVAALKSSDVSLIVFYCPNFTHVYLC